VYTELLAPGVTGKIQVGAVPGAKAHVMVPACGVPDSAGIEPNDPFGLTPVLLVLAVPQAASTVAPTAASAAS
jgi:hypothetical protein